MQSNTSTAVRAEQPSGPMLVCLIPGCKEALASRNKRGYCQRHSHKSPQLCKEAGCTTQLFCGNTSGYCKRHLYKLIKGPRLNDVELEARRADDRWEEHHGEKDTIACRICGILRARLGSNGEKRNHLLDDHGLTVPEYEQHCQSRGWGTPPVFSLKALEAKRAAAARRRAADPKGLNLEKREAVQRNLSEDDKKMRVRCPVKECGEWHRRLGPHLRAVHQMSVAACKVYYPNFPVIAPDLAALATARIQAALAKQRQDELGRLLAEHEQRRKPEAPKGKKNRGLETGATLGDTSARITVAASLDEEMKPAQMAPHLYPLQGVKENARHNATVFLGRNKGKIKLERLRLAGLSEGERNSQVEAANRTLHAKG